MRSVNLTSKLISICAGSLVIMFLACLAMFLKTLEAEKEGLMQKWMTTVVDMKTKIGTQFIERYADGQAFARNTLLQTKNSEEIAKAFNAYMSLYGIYDLIVLVDLDGQVIASNTVDASNQALDTASLMKQNFASSSWFTNVVNERFSEDTEKGLTGVFVEDIMIDPLSSLVYKDKRLGLSFSTPVRDASGKMVAVISCRSSLRWVEKRFTDLYETFKKEGLLGADLTLLNKKGEMVVHYKPSEQNAGGAIVRDFDNVLFKINLVSMGQPAALAAARGEEGTLVAKHMLRNELRLDAFASVKDEGFLDELGWILLFRIEEPIYLASIYQAKQYFYGVCGLVLTLCVSGSGIFAVGLSRRLKIISASIAQSGKTVDKVSIELANATHELSSGATEVASSVQETVSFLEELTSMVKSNTENAGEAASLAQNSGRIAE